MKSVNWNKLGILVGIFILSFFVPFFIFAKPISKNDAKKAVIGWLKTKPYFFPGSVHYRVKTTTEYKGKNGKNIFFVIKLSPSGYVITSADDLLEPIIACSATGKFVENKNNFLWILVNRDMPARIRYAVAMEKKLKAKTIRLSGKLQKNRKKWYTLKTYGTSHKMIYRGIESVNDPRVDPLLETQWSQTTVSGQACYNYYTPTGPGNWQEGNANNYPCGCVATAMGQIMRYHQYPTDGVGTASFTVTVDGNSETKQLRGGDGSGGAYDWTSMTLIPANGISETGRKAIGALLYDCGVSVHMSYTSSASGAYVGDAASAFTSVFKYSNAIEAWHNNQELVGNGFNKMVNPNLDAGLPVMLGVTGNLGGHAIVCDGYGYNSDTLYHHLNMGWAGVDDAWYNLPTMSGSFADFDTVYDCIYNIYKSGTGEIISGRVTDSEGNPQSELTVTATAGETDYTATTNSRGIWAITNLPSGTTYTVTCETATESKSVSVGTSVTNSITVGNVWQVDFTVPSLPMIAVDTSELKVTAVTGRNPASSSFQVWNSGKDTLNYTITDDADWLECSPSSGDSTGASDKDTITVSYNTTALPAGTYTATITITDDNASNSPQTISVSLEIKNFPYICVSLTSITASCNFGENPASQTVDVWNSVSGTTLNFKVAKNVYWLDVTPTSGSSNGPSDKCTLTVSFNASKLGVGQYSANITISDPTAFNKSLIISVTLTVGPVNSIPMENMIEFFNGAGNSVAIDAKHRVYFFGDESGNKYGAYQSRARLRPRLTETITGSAVLSFNGKEFLYTGSNQHINLGGPFSEKSVVIAFKTGDDIISRQVLFAQGGPKRGFNAYIYQNNLFFAIWNTTDDAGTNTGWGPIYVSTEILPSTFYCAGFVFDETNDQFKGYKNGGLFSTTSGVGKLYDCKYGFCIGKAYRSTLFHDGRKRAKGFSGYVCDIFYYNDVLSSSEVNKITQYVSNKYKDAFSDANDFVLLLSASYGVNITYTNYVKLWRNAPGDFILRSSGKSTPLYEYDLLNSLEGVTFDGVDDVMKAKNSSLLNAARQGFTEKTIFLIFKTGRDTSGRQVIWAEGNKKTGLNIYLHNGKIYLGAWNCVSNKTSNDSWGPAFVNASISTETAYYAEFVLDGTNQILKGFLKPLSNSASLIDMGTVTAGKLLRHPAVSVGGARTTLQYADGVQSKGNHFGGTLFEVLVYNKLLSTDDETKVVNYITGKYIQ